MVWLIGNTQPMRRGSGTVAELFLAVVHLHHGRNPPILKLNYPQLDVLDISFPCDDYDQLFPNFFEPQTIPPGLQCQLSPTQSTEDELAQLYATLLYNPIRYCEQIKKRVLCELNQELTRLTKGKNKPLTEGEQKRSDVLISLKADLNNIEIPTARDDTVDHYVKELNEKIKSSLENPDLDKYPGLSKWGIRFCNALMLITAPLSMPIKYLATDSVFFSTQGKSKEAVQKTQAILKRTQKQKT